MQFTRTLTERKGDFDFDGCSEIRAAHCTGHEAVTDARFFVYVLASKRNGTLYVGVTNNLAHRLAEHKAKLVPGFTRKYEVDQLVYFEAFDSILEARARTFVEALAACLENRVD
jgi:predicted GIY-YIG superfamily endonuclease